MVKSPAAAQEQRQLKPGKAGLSVPRDSDWIRAGKESGVGFSACSLVICCYCLANFPAMGQVPAPRSALAQAAPRRQASLFWVTLEQFPFVVLSGERWH
jgi:hypothetical protein